ncbi:MAG TPA: hypothetical protein VGM50_21790 [Gemmatimonadaceae bacterium]|jgi:hypothetical protein
MTPALRFVPVRRGERTFYVELSKIAYLEWSGPAGNTTTIHLQGSDPIIVDGDVQQVISVLATDPSVSFS